MERESPYNVILGRPSLNKLGTIVSTTHLTMKFPLLNCQVGTIHAYQREARQCYVDCLRIKKGENPLPRAGQTHNSRVTDVNLAKLDLREDFREDRPKLEGELIKVRLNSRENGFVQVGAQLPEDLRI